SLIISDNEGVKYNVIDQQFSTVETLPVAPSKGHFTRDIDPDRVPYVFDEFYNSNNWYPSSNIMIDDPYVLRDLRGLTVQFNPMQFNPAEGVVKICTRMVVEIIDDQSAEVINPINRITPLNNINKEFSDI